MNEEKNTQKSFLDKTKAKWKDTTLKSRILLATLILGLIMVVVTAIVSLAFDPETFTDETKRNAWLVRTIIMVAISTFGIIIGEQLGLEMLLKKADGLYQVTLGLYREQRNKIIQFIDSFADWFVWYKAKELRRKKIDFLISEDMSEDAEKILNHIYEIDLEAIQQHPIKIIDEITKQEIVIKKKTEEQARAIEWVKQGHIQMVTNSPNYYVAKDEEASNAFTLEKGIVLDKIEKNDIWFSRIYKIASVIVVSVAMASVTASDFMRADDVQAWVNLIFRIFSLFGSLASGWLTASRTKDRKVAKISNKCDVLMYFEKDMISGNFKPLTYEEKVRKEIEEYEHSKEEQNANNGNEELYVSEVDKDNTCKSE